MLPTVTGYWYFTLSLFTVFSRLACTSNVNQSLFGSKCTNTLYWYNVVAFFPGIRQCQVDPLHLKSAIVPFLFQIRRLDWWNHLRDLKSGPFHKKTSLWGSIENTPHRTHAYREHSVYKLSSGNINADDTVLPVKYAAKVLYNSCFCVLMTLCMWAKIFRDHLLSVMMLCFGIIMIADGLLVDLIMVVQNAVHIKIEKLFNALFVSR